MVTGAGLEIQKHAFCSFFWAVWHALLWKCNVDYDFAIIQRSIIGPTHGMQF